MTLTLHFVVLCCETKRLLKYRSKELCDTVRRTGIVSMSRVMITYMMHRTFRSDWHILHEFSQLIDLLYKFLTLSILYSIGQKCQ